MVGGMAQRASRGDRPGPRPAGELAAGPEHAAGPAAGPEIAGLLAHADAGARAAAVLELQRVVGNAGAGRLVARQPADAGGGGGGAGGAAADPLQQALQELRDSTELVDRNTAELIDGGRLTALYLEDLRTDPDSDALLDGWGIDKTAFVVRLSPAGERMVVQKNAIGTVYQEGGKSYIFVGKTLSVASMKATLVHESNHAMRLHEAGHTDAADSIERYADEFQAYWVDPDFRGEADLDKRAANIKAHLLRDYPALKARYDTDADFKAAVDAHTRPDANVLNSARWRAIEEAVAGWGTDESAIYAAIQAMSPEERAIARTDPNLMALLRGDLSGDELQRALLLLEGAGEATLQAIDAMSGLGTDEDALFRALGSMGTHEKLIVRRNAWFMGYLRDDLTDDEYARAMELLDVPVGDFPMPTRPERMA
jgi:hypothetical protein